MVTTPVIEDGQPAIRRGEDRPPVPSSAHSWIAEPSPPAGPPGGSDRPSAQPPSLADGRPPDDGPAHSPQEQPDVPVSSAEPISPPMDGPPPMIRRRRRTRRRTVLTVVAAVLAVAAIVAVTVMVRPATQTVAGTGRPAGAPVTTEAPGSPGGTNATSPAPPPPATTPFQPAPPVPSVVPAPSLAIPTVRRESAVGDNPDSSPSRRMDVLPILPVERPAYVTVLDTSINKVVADRYRYRRGPRSSSPSHPMAAVHTSASTTTT